MAAILFHFMTNLTGKAMSITGTTRVIQATVLSILATVVVLGDGRTFLEGG